MERVEIAKMAKVAPLVAAQEEILDSDLRELLEAFGEDPSVIFGAPASEKKSEEQEGGGKKREKAGEKKKAAVKQSAEEMWKAVFAKEAEEARVRSARAKRKERAMDKAMERCDERLQPALEERYKTLRKVWKRDPKPNEIFKGFDKDGKGFDLGELPKMMRRDLGLKASDISDEEIAALVKTLDVNGTGRFDVSGLGQYADQKMRRWKDEKKQQQQQQKRKT